MAKDNREASKLTYRKDVKISDHHDAGLTEKQIGKLPVNIEVNANDAIKTLKAIQREAREATKALRELESVPDHVKNYGKHRGVYHAKWDSNLQAWLNDIPTEVLTRELVKREGIECYDVSAHEEGAKITIHDQYEGSTYFVEGPAKIIVNKD